MADIVDVEGIEIPIGTHEGKTVVVGSDHRGFEYKEKIKKLLTGKRYHIVDVGTHSPERCDYPPISAEIGRIVSGECLNSAGIGICGSGIGILEVAGKHKRIYPARCLNPKEAETSRRHNNSNVLGIGADYTDLDTALATVEAWLATPFYSDPENEQPYLDRYVQKLKLEDSISSLQK